MDKCFHQLLGTNVALKIADSLKNEKYAASVYLILPSDTTERILIMKRFLWIYGPCSVRILSGTHSVLYCSHWKHANRISGARLDSKVAIPPRISAVWAFWVSAIWFTLLAITRATQWTVFGALSTMWLMRSQNDITCGGYPMAITGIQLSS